MQGDRRTFLRIAAGAAGWWSLGARRVALAPNPGAAPRPLRLLVLGGSGFIGPHIVRHALARGHRVTLFNRGRTNPQLFPEVEKLRGDRDGKLQALEGRRWDAVIDNSASIPRWVRDSTALLRDAARRYLFTSSISVYADHSRPGLTEDAPVGRLEDPETEEITGASYGPLKALCEEEVRRAFAERATIVRPGLIVGPGDPTDRFTYWPARIHRGGDVLAPGNPADPVQFVDARDLAAWYLSLIEADREGTFHATGPASPLSVAELLYGVRAITASPVRFTWVDAEFLAAHEVQPWSELTVWVPPRDGYEGFARVDCSRAIDAGLEFRPLADTARDTLEWYLALPESRRREPRAGLPAEKEARVLAAWRAREPRRGRSNQ